MKRLFLATGLLLATNPSPANAQAGDPYDLMMSADANSDGRVSRDELIASRGEMFAKLDRNGDGVLSDADLRRMPPRLASKHKARIDQIIKDFDADGSGDVAKQEFADGPTPFFDKADANGDGFVTTLEAKAAKPGA